ncbi:MAG: zinc-ribbon domain-containing protein, partial [Mogibacterium sp.]|nr:zinc-ribbon domain-containing protein [Mogibacterium sp.]
DYAKNGDITPDMIMPHANKKFWWLCEKGHSWKEKLCIKTEEDTEYGSMTYELEKTRLQIRFTAPYSTERRRNAGECVRKNRVSKISDKQGL